MINKSLFRLKRHYSSQSTTSTIVRLAFDKYASKTPTKKSPLIICHGLFGSKQNWASLCRAASQRMQRDIYAVDLRNHGDSGHNEQHDFPSMAHDLLAFMDDHQLEKPILVGHSMGGKAVMMTALMAPEKVEQLISIDMPPVALKLSQGFSTYIQALEKINQAQCTKQSQADQILQQVESNVGIRLFLMTNLKRNQDHVFQCRLPLTTLANNLSTIGGFPVLNDDACYDKPTLFIAGGKSPYYPPFLTLQNQIKKYFPNDQLKVVENAGHWVHAEKPDIVLSMIQDFIETPSTQ
ncbi:Alpha/Beta hydrolase protein [Cunninghamella echinulata]|nr:Alpha/Beta hydrolase protein [Cunninghamella echinulata]